MDLGTYEETGGESNFLVQDDKVHISAALARNLLLECVPRSESHEFACKRIFTTSFPSTFGSVHGAKGEVILAENAWKQICTPISAYFLIAQLFFVSIHHYLNDGPSFTSATSDITTPAGNLASSGSCQKGKLIDTKVFKAHINSIFESCWSDLISKG